MGSFVFAQKGLAANPASIFEKIRTGWYSFYPFPSIEAFPGGEP